MKDFVIQNQITLLLIEKKYKHQNFLEENNRNFIIRLQIKHMRNNEHASNTPYILYLLNQTKIILKYNSKLLH